MENTTFTTIRNGERKVSHYAWKMPNGEITAACGAKLNAKAFTETNTITNGLLFGATCHRCIGINGRTGFKPNC